MGATDGFMYRRAAEYVDMILKDRPPSELPVEQPTKFELVINLKAAKSTALDVAAFAVSDCAAFSNR